MLFAIVHYNTPMLTTCLISSIYKIYPTATVIVFDNSDVSPLYSSAIRHYSIRYYDNTHQDIINFADEIKAANLPVDERFARINNLASVKHCCTVDWLLQYLPYDEIILLDSDILLFKPLDFSTRHVITAGQLSEEEVETRDERRYRILPYCQYFNLNLIRRYNLHYFDAKRIIVFLNQEKVGRWAYDTGASFYEDVITQYPRLCRTDIDLDKYIVHYKGGSWATNTKTVPYDAWLGYYAKLWSVSK